MENNTILISHGRSIKKLIIENNQLFIEDYLSNISIFQPGKIIIQIKYLILKII